MSIRRFKSLSILSPLVVNNDGESDASKTNSTSSLNDTKVKSLDSNGNIDSYPVLRQDRQAQETGVVIATESKNGKPAETKYNLIVCCRRITCSLK